MRYNREISKSLEVLPLEEMLKQILENQKEMSKKLDEHSEQFEIINTDIKLMNVSMNELQEGQTQIITRLDTIDTRLTNIENKLGEHTHFVEAFSQDVARTATKESIARIDTKIDLINNKLFQTETEIAMLKIAK